ncbi:unnamed protein product [Somion occarium]|uniref:Uncharacterized protein n=1 Tax=Somion occarium TaxID=3059160 RepID=A0ABP1CTW3_9APHY
MHVEDALHSPYLQTFNYLYEQLTAARTDKDIRLANRLISVETDKEGLGTVIHGHGPTSASEASTTLELFAQRDILALEQCGGQRHDATEAEENCLPGWFLLYSVHRRVHSTQDAKQAWILCKSYLSSQSPELKDVLLISFAWQFVQFGVEDCMQDLVNEFTRFPEAISTASSDALLRILCMASATETIRACVVSMLNALADGRAPIAQTVLEQVLQRDRLNLDIALAVERCIIAQGAIPAHEQTKALQCLWSPNEWSTVEVPSSTFFQDLKVAFDHPTLYMIDSLSTAKTYDEVVSILETAGVLTWKWLYVTLAPTMREAIERLSRVGVDVPTQFNASQASQNGQGPPAWLILHLLRNRILTAEDAALAFHLVDHHHASLAEPLRSCSLILSAYWCAKLRVITFLRRIVQRVFSLSETFTERHYDFFLRALTYGSASKELSILIKTILWKMSKLNISASTATYDRLHDNDILTLEVAEATKEHMKIQGISPSSHHLEALVRLFARSRQREKAKRYLMMLRKALLTDGRSLLPLGPNPGSQSAGGFTSPDRFYIESFKRFSAMRRYVQLIAVGHGRHVRPATKHGRNSDTSPQPNDHSSGTNGAGAIDNDRKDPGGQDIPSKEVQPSHSLPSTTASFHLGIEDWTATLHVAANDKEVPSKKLLDLFRKGITMMRLPPTIVTYCVVIRGLLAKGGAKDALLLWRELCESGHTLDTIAIGIGVTVLTYNDLAHEAFALLESVYSCQDMSLVNKRRRRRSGLHVNIYALNQFMVALSRNGRPDVVYELWSNLERLYQVEPDVYTFNIMLRTARWALKLNESLRGTLAELGLLRPPGSSPSHHSSSRDVVAACITSMLDPNIPHRVLGFWEGHSAGKVALRITRDMFFQNWPELQSVKGPVRALRSSGSSQLVSPMSDAFHSLRGGPKTLPNMESMLPSLPQDAIMKTRYARIVPTDPSFRIILDLLAAESLAAEIPLVLAWMRSLNIWPSKSTLATALVYWSAVSSDAPLIQAWKGGEQKSPYAQLLAWMTEWVGESNMPEPANIAMQLRRVRFYREANYLDIIEQRRNASDVVD